MGSDRLPWPRLLVLLRWLPADCALLRAHLGDAAAAWGPAEHLLAGLLDATVWGNWQRGGDKTARRPTPVPRPTPRDPQREAVRTRILDKLRRRARGR